MFIVEPEPSMTFHGVRVKVGGPMPSLAKPWLVGTLLNCLSFGVVG